MNYHSKLLPELHKPGRIAVPNAFETHRLIGKWAVGLGFRSGVVLPREEQIRP